MSNGNLTHRLELRVDAATYSQVAAHAAKHDRTQGHVVRIALREFFARQARAAARDKATRLAR